MTCSSLRLMGLALVLVAVQCAAAMAMDPRIPNYEFKYSLYPPGGFNPKRSQAILRADPKKPKAFPIVGKDGKFADFAQWYYAIGSDPQNFEKWWMGYFSDDKVWSTTKTPVFEGTSPSNQGHRIIAWLGTFKRLVDSDPDIDPAVKQALVNEEWTRAAEKTVISTINPVGMLEYRGNKADMACVFHFLRTKFGAIGLKVDNIYTIERAQDLIVSILTLPWVICAEDRYLAPPDADYLEGIGKQYGGTESDIRIVKDGRILYTGGLFIGWRSQPSLHGTWDGLSIINSLFRYHRESDPNSPNSIFYKWNKLPESEKAIAKKAIILCSRRLWLDWAENKGRTWCWVRDGKPTDDDSKPSEAPFLPAYDGYGDNQVGWAKMAWDEMFGEPMRNTNDGAQALLAIAHGAIHKNLKIPIGQQVPYRYDFDPEVQKKRLEEDRKRLGITDGAAPAAIDETPKLNPNKERPGATSDK